MSKWFIVNSLIPRPISNTSACSGLWFYTPYGPLDHTDQWYRINIWVFNAF